MTQQLTLHQKEIYDGPKVQLQLTADVPWWENDVQRSPDYHGPLTDQGLHTGARQYGLAQRKGGSLFKQDRIKKKLRSSEKFRRIQENLCYEFAWYFTLSLFLAWAERKTSTEMFYVFWLSTSGVVLLYYLTVTEYGEIIFSPYFYRVLPIYVFDFDQVCSKYYVFDLDQVW